MHRKQVTPFILIGVGIVFLAILDRDYQLERLADSIREGLEPLFLLFIVGIFLAGVGWIVLGLIISHTAKRGRAVNATVTVPIETAQTKRGQDVTATVTVSMKTAQLGGSARILLSTGRAIEVKVPARTHDGAQLRLRGLGMSGADGSEPGDALITVEIEPIDEAAKQETAETLAAEARNAISVLDRNSDQLIQSLCGFNPAKAGGRMRKALSESMGKMYLKWHRQYSVEEIAAWKLLEYRDQVLGQPIEKEINIGIIKLRKTLNGNYNKPELCLWALNLIG
jgi:hypothetical protein